jgi:hypothetical protein
MIAMAENDLVPREADEPRDSSGQPNSQPSDDKVGAGGSTDAGQQQARSAAGIPGPEECQRSLVATARLTLQGAISPQQANILRGIYTTLYDQQKDQHAVAGVKPKDMDGLVSALRQNPHLATVLESILTAEDVAALMAHARES